MHISILTTKNVNAAVTFLCDTWWEDSIFQKHFGVFGNILEMHKNNLNCLKCIGQKAVLSLFHKIVALDQTFCAQTTLCLLTILIAAKGSGIAAAQISKT